MKPARWLILAGCLLVAVSVMAATPSPALAPKPLPEVDALHFEKYDLALQGIQAEIGRLQERMERIKEHAMRHHQTVMARDKIPPRWRLNLPQRRWDPPAVPKAGTPPLATP